MENASKALLMAAGVLIGLLVISLAVYLFTSFASTSADVHKQNEQQQIEQFNSQFTSYVGKEGITIYDVVTVANLATENNRYYEYPKRKFAQEPQTATDSYISVQLKNATIEKGNETKNNTNNGLIKQELETIEKNNSKELPQYNCQVSISPTTGRVCLVTFTQK